MVKRPSWNEFWFLQTLMYSTRGTCNRLLGAIVLVDDKNYFISAGYNGSVRGMPHCDKVGHLLIDGHCKRTFHAEENGIFNTIDLERLRGASAYLVYSPCLKCTMMLVDRGVKNIFYLLEFTNINEEERRYREELIKSKGVTLKQVKLNLRKLINDAIEILEGLGGAL